ncbi:divalent-cation tolerance protein CutA [Oscillatoriales cyanobacterium LEGE 11467]|uniref:Divalent-cation tolerance protein CutA n=1 Tax=Zarconia navalis LEGE 11467 TaxID=1828826 RepID=A0A928VSI0_9CYAN|nr:divalent-cation tolerance protein CutA [Zarconia navalis]MBE9039462.1 divalent-cation tolerance protein CutA [Zarconia navalis LEGE 11467]
MSASKSEYGIVLVTASSEEEAKTIARSLVEEKLAACATLTPVRSIYSWNGEINSDSEWQLVIKTNLALFWELESRVKQLHSYDVPEIIATEIVAGSTPYLDWIGAMTREQR